MKTFIFNVCILAAGLLLLSGCDHVDTSVSQIKNAGADPSISMDSLYEHSAEELQQMRHKGMADSLNILHTLRLALKIADKHQHEESFTLRSDTLTIDYGYRFSKKAKHLLVRRSFQYGTYSDIYLFDGSAFKKVAAKEMASLAYIGDTICDVNGDQRPDYLFHWYPMSGCCLRDVYNVFLQKENGTFSQETEFINPEFSPREKLVRGLCYGYFPSHYKFKWNGFTVDTIEYIDCPDSANGQHYIRKKRDNDDGKGDVLKDLPTEYNQVGDKLIRK